MLFNVDQRLFGSVAAYGGDSLGVPLVPGVDVSFQVRMRMDRECQDV